MRWIVFAVVSVLAVGCCKSTEQQKKDRAEKSAKKAKLAEARARCGKAWGTNQWESVCRDLVRKRLTRPATADFSYLMDVGRLANEARCQQFYASTVKAQNAFGVEIEHEFRCIFDTKRDWVTVDYLR